MFEIDEEEEQPRPKKKKSKSPAKKMVPLGPIMDKVYVQKNKVGLASYHFDKKGPYVSYAAAPSHWELSDGRKVPSKKKFINPKYNAEERTFKGTISWEVDNDEVDFMGVTSWDYEMVFSSDFKFIESGTCESYDIGGLSIRVDNFGTDLGNLDYKLLKK